MKARTLLFVILAMVVLANVAGAEEKTYVVQPGDTLSGIVWTINQQQGVSVGLGDLQKWNPGLGTALKEGQVITYYVPDPVPTITAEDVRREVTEAFKNQPQPIPQPQPRPQVVERIIEKTVLPPLWAVILAVASLLLVVILAFLVLRRRSSKRQAEPVEAPALEEAAAATAVEQSFSVTLNLGGTKYRYFPEMDEDGHPLGLQEIYDGRKAFRLEDVAALCRSLRGSLKGTALFQRELDAGRLVPME